MTGSWPSEGCPKDQAESTIGAELVHALTERGMAHVVPHTPADPAWLRPATPDLALQGVLAGHQSRLARDQQLLLDAHQRLAEAQAQYGIGMNGPFPEHLVAVVCDPAQISELSASLVNTARQDWMTLQDLRTEMPLTGDFAQVPPPAARGQVRCRSIYPAAAMEDPAARQIIQASADAGEQARLLPQVPMKMKLADHTTAMLPLTPAGTGGALVIHAPVIIAALRDYFELLWQQATPVTPCPHRRTRRPAHPHAARHPRDDGRRPERRRDCPAHRPERHHRPPSHHGAAGPAERHQPVRGRRGRPAARLDRLTNVTAQARR